MPITPPKCKTCDVAEWNHVCNKQLVKSRARKIEERRVSRPKRNKQKCAK